MALGRSRGPGQRAGGQSHQYKYLCKLGLQVFSVYSAVKTLAMSLLLRVLSTIKLPFN